MNNPIPRSSNWVSAGILRKAMESPDGAERGTMKIIAVLLALALVFPGAAALPAAQAQDVYHVAASFYPVYVIAQNVLEGVEGVEITSLAPGVSGCLHDYQLLASDMKALSQADVFLINGAGMETYLDAISAQMPRLPIIDASQGIELLPNDTSHEEHGHTTDDGHDHDHGEFNSHIWLSPRNAAMMADNLARGLAKLLPDQEERMLENAQNFLIRMTALQKEIADGLKDVKRRDIVTFHEAFPYFAKAFDLHTVAVINREPDQPLPPSLLAEVTQQVKEAGNPPLFIEAQYSDLAAKVISQETGAMVFELDPVVSGAGGLDAYETAMLKNLKVLQEALNQ